MSRSAAVPELWTLGVRVYETSISSSYLSELRPSRRLGASSLASVDLGALALRGLWQSALFRFAQPVFVRRTYGFVVFLTRIFCRPACRLVGLDHFGFRWRERRV